MNNIIQLENKINEIKKKNLNIKEKPIILLDQDDVLAELVLEVLEIYNQKYNTNHTLSDITSWNIGSILGNKVYEIMFDEKVFSQLKEVPLMKECLKLLVESELFNIQIVSAARYNTCCNKYMWIKEHLPFFDLENINFSSNKNLFRGDILFDDSPIHLENFNFGEAIIFDKPYNNEENYPKLKNLKRVYNWLEFSEYILDKFY